VRFTSYGSSIQVWLNMNWNSKLEWSPHVYGCATPWSWTTGYTRKWKFSCVSSSNSRLPNSTNRDLLLVQRAKPATKREMTQFHSDEYVDFLSRITPTNMNSYIKEQHKCLFSLCFHPSFLEIRIFDVSDSWTYGDLQITSVMIVLYSTVCSNIAQYPPEDRWVRELFSGSRSTSRGSDVFVFGSQSSLEGAARLSRDKCDIAVNWAGGLHHGKKSEASGFCFVNGMAILILFVVQSSLCWCLNINV